MDVAIRGALIALLMVLATIMYRDRPRLAAVRIGVAMALGLCAQVISATPLFEAMVPRVWQVPWVAISVGNAVLFWIFVQALFDDGFALRPAHVVSWLSVALLSGLNCAALANSASVFSPVSMGIQRAIPVIFAVLAAIAAAKHWRSDLVEERRRLRLFVVLTGVAYSLAFLFARLASPQGRLVGLTALLDVACLLAIVLVLVSRLLRLGPTNLFPSSLQQAADHPHAGASGNPPHVLEPLPEANDTLPPDPAEEQLTRELLNLMSVKQVYRNENVNLASLAAQLNTPEYKLRRLINQRMGYRNFNAFVNGYRLDAVRAALLDPTQSHLPVLTLALEAGFQSIGPFNRAFKAATGQTPTQFRQNTLADCTENSADS